MRLLKIDPHVPLLLHNGGTRQSLPAISMAGYGTFRKAVSFVSRLLLPVLRPESRSAVQRPHGFHYLPLQQIAVRAAYNSGVDTAWRRVPCRAFRLGC